ncbi:MAG TPA: acyl-CoA dehydratase activase, partial [Spirochaetota bacterium]|nr:acyl-CoA dehydratase activase [Spirochaetota bacterium]
NQPILEPQVSTLRQHSLLYTGVDIGSTTIKIILLDEYKKIIYTYYNRHNAEIDKVLINVLKEIKQKFGQAELKLNITGSAGMGLSETINLPFVQEVVASATAGRYFYPDISSLVDIGGEDSKLVFFNGKHIDIRMNGSCAGGTGAFIDQMISLLDISGAELNKLAAASKNIYTIASRCGVFAKTDVQNLIAAQVSKEDIAASIFDAVAVQIISALSRGKDISPRVLFTGGPLHFYSQLRHAMIRRLSLNDNDTVLPEYAHVFPALGAALDKPENNFRININRLIKKISADREHLILDTPLLDPLFENKTELQEWRRKKNQQVTNFKHIKEAAGKELYIGIDSGSTTSKIVVIDKNGHIFFQYYVSNHGDPVEAIVSGLKKLKLSARDNNINLNIKHTAVTGYGEDLIKAAFNIDIGLVETLAHYHAACHFNKKVSFVLDIGGQDMKA